MPRFPLRLRAVVAAAVLGTLLAVLLAGPALADGTSVVFPQPVSPNGHRIYDLYVIVSWFAIPIFIGVEISLLVIILKFRRRGPDHYGKNIHGNTKLEIAWFVAPTIIVVFIAYISFVELERDFNPDSIGKNVAAAGDSIPASDQMNVLVQGYQFNWTYTYTDPAYGNLVAKDTLVVPVGKFVRLTMRSDNVIHSWWVPAITGKTDAVPGYDNYSFLQIERAGSWEGECAELCGVGHYQMQIKVQALDPAAFNSWVAQAKSAPAGKPAPAPSPSK